MSILFPKTRINARVFLRRSTFEEHCYGREFPAFLPDRGGRRRNRPHRIAPSRAPAIVGRQTSSGRRAGFQTSLSRGGRCFDDRCTDAGPARERSIGRFLAGRCTRKGRRRTVARSRGGKFSWLQTIEKSR